MSALFIPTGNFFGSESWKNGGARTASVCFIVQKNVMIINFVKILVAKEGTTIVLSCVISLIINIQPIVVTINLIPIVSVHQIKDMTDGIMM